MKKWQIINKIKNQSIRQAQDRKSKIKNEEVIYTLLENRGLKTKNEISEFLHPPDPYTLTPKDVDINKKALLHLLTRIQKAIKNKESIVVYADYDADGVTAGAIMWETLHGLGASVMPYIPHRVDEGYGLSKKGIDNVKRDFNPTLIITVDHGITALEKVDYATSLGIEVIITDHHVKPKKLPKCLVVHTTRLCGAGVAWFVAKELLSSQLTVSSLQKKELLALATIGTIADMVPLVGANRHIVKWGLLALNKTQRTGLKELIRDAGLNQGEIDAYHVSHMLAPRLNAMGRLVHALDALRLLCTKRVDKAREFAKTLGLTNKERQQLTIDTALHARELVVASVKRKVLNKLLFVGHEEYNPGVIGLVAGKLVEEFYRPAIVFSRGEVVSKASARSITGFSIIEAIRSCSDILIDAGGHPMAAGFTIETAKLELLKKRLEDIAEKELDEEKLTRVLKIDLEIPLEIIHETLWKKNQELAPFGIGNPEPVFVSRGVKIHDIRLIGKEGKHLKLKLTTHNSQLTALDAVAFGMGELYGKLDVQKPLDIAYSIDMNTWKGDTNLQLKLKDISF